MPRSKVTRPDPLADARILRSWHAEFVQCGNASGYTLEDLNREFRICICLVLKMLVVWAGGRNTSRFDELLLNRVLPRIIDRARHIYDKGYLAGFNSETKGGKGVSDGLKFSQLEIKKVF